MGLMTARPRGWARSNWANEIECGVGVLAYQGQPARVGLQVDSRDLSIRFLQLRKQHHSLADDASRVSERSAKLWTTTVNVIKS